MRHFLGVLGLLLAVLAGAGCGSDVTEVTGASGLSIRAAVPLPPEAVSTIELIRRGGPFPYRKDGSVFQNREGLLPAQPRGHYREFTVPTPGARDRGARRIVTGGDPPAEFYYTADHYRSFVSVEVGP